MLEHVLLTLFELEQSQSHLKRYFTLNLQILLVPLCYDMQKTSFLRLIMFAGP